MSKKEEIILATLELASKNGFKDLSMSKIATSVGIKKPSLYNHFESKEILIREMYQYIREKSKDKFLANSFDLNDISDKSAYDILSQFVFNYKNMVMDKDMFNFYKVIYSERTVNCDAAKILVEENEKMIEATKFLFDFLVKNKKLFIDNIDMAALSFSMTIHSILDYEFDLFMVGSEYDFSMLEKYIEWFCDSYCKEVIL